MELEALEKACPEMRSLGATLVAISPQLIPYCREMVNQRRLTFDVLSDRGNKVAKRFGLVFTLPHDLRQVYIQLGAYLKKFNGDDSWTLPMPGRFIIDPDSIIRHADVDADYTVRAEPDKTVDALKDMNTGTL